MISVKVTCRVCKGSHPADDFKLHYEFRQMVCPNCYSGKTQKLKEKEELAKKEVPQKPAGWDQVDDYLEKAARTKKQDEQKAQFTKIPGTDQVKCKCLSCKFSFKYNPFRKLPRTCPFCNADIPKLRTFSLL
ncbi:hypothetical protein HOL21_00295 [Candidatus Woesearchaeota archaeon]|jgi:hypothetical protein|nr:hypothetical protein [Candidatus Woesearchaeota archaeon]MBT5396637.1 hypothetical protein [Candidatus Woesearchaeota archaeon]MBT5924633.1 hypothetical protein [Candidatus Woesearchaeota archaeon]MBT6367576.1 hypothetical protein [Candidatus Woesearchaeota archaeon]MBT7763075.1 hypothetical protein [Candidatus Woesearchaeota archaeon]